MSEPGSAITEDEIAAWRCHVGRTETRRQVLDAESLRRFAAAVGSDLDVERVMPPLGHWAYFLETVDSSAIGPDGHARRGRGLLPPVSLPNRMFAASSIRFVAPLRLSQEAELTLTVADFKHKVGKSGDLILIDVDRVIAQDGSPRIMERQTLIYRGRQGSVNAIHAVEPEQHADRTSWTPDAVELFRFSAATFNAHRIHYDIGYAQRAEGYPGLVVHGPLTAAKLFGFARSRYCGGNDPQSFEFRALAPLFADQPVRLVTGGDGKVDAMRCDRTVAMSGRCSAVFTSS